MVLRLGLIISKGLLDPANKRLSSVNDIHWVWVVIPSRTTLFLLFHRDQRMPLVFKIIRTWKLGVCFLTPFRY